jgi:hypothetical protein
MIHGSFEQMNLKLYSYTMSVSLIGRRLVQNAGTRYNKRGLNSQVFLMTNFDQDFDKYLGLSSEFCGS